MVRQRNNSFLTVDDVTVRRARSRLRFDSRLSYIRHVRGQRKFKNVCKLWLLIEVAMWKLLRVRHKIVWEPIIWAKLGQNHHDNNWPQLVPS